MDRLPTGRAVASMAPVWLGSIVGVVLIAVLAGERYLTWLPVAMGLCVLLALGIQLAIGMRPGLVSRLGGSVAGALVVVGLATLVLLVANPGGLHILV